MARLIRSKKKYKGFSLIEVLVSLFLFSTAIVSIVGMMTLEMRKSMLKRNETIAGQLAQEGIELVRNIRDNNFMNSSAVEAFDGIGAGNNQSIDYNDDQINGNNYGLNLNASGLYEHVGAGGATVFQRKIMIEGVPASHQRTIYSVVVWEEGIGMGAVNPGNVDDDCIVGNKCFFTKVTLTDNWGKAE